MRLTHFLPENVMLDNSVCCFVAVVELRTVRSVQSLGPALSRLNNIIPAMNLTTATHLVEIDFNPLYSS